MLRHSGEQLRYKPTCSLHQREQRLPQPPILHIGWDEQALSGSHSERIRHEPLGANGSSWASERCYFGVDQYKSGEGKLSSHDFECEYGESDRFSLNPLRQIDDRHGKPCQARVNLMNGSVIAQPLRLYLFCTIYCIESAVRTRPYVCPPKRVLFAKVLAHAVAHLVPWRASLDS